MRVGESFQLPGFRSNLGTKASVRDAVIQHADMLRSWAMSAMWAATAAS